jgi:hypothetical protein
LLVLLVSSNVLLLLNLWAALAALNFEFRRLVPQRAETQPAPATAPPSNWAPDDDDPGAPDPADKPSTPESWNW